MPNRGALLLLAIPVQAVNLVLAAQFFGQFTPEPLVSTDWEQQVQSPCQVGVVEGVLEAAPYETMTIEHDGLHIEISTTRQDDQNQQDTRWSDNEE